MTCKRIQNKVAVGDHLKASEQAHLDHCPDCSAFRSDVVTLQCDRPLETPKALKHHVLRNSLRVLTHEAFETPKRKMIATPRPSFMVGVGVVLAFVVTGLLVLNLYCTEATLACRFLIGVLFLVFLQNAITALFVPLFLQKKLNIHF